MRCVRCRHKVGPRQDGAISNQPQTQKNPVKALQTVLIAIGLFASTMFAPSAYANEFGTHLMITSAPGGGRFCMDADGDRKADGTRVFLYQCHGRENQRWSVTHNVDGTSAITGAGGLCLDVRGNGSHNGTPVQLYQCHFGANQRFRIFDDGRIQEVASGKCLMVLPEWMNHDHDADDRWIWDRLAARDYDHVRFAERDGAPIVLHECEERALQFWRLAH